MDQNQLSAVVLAALLAFAIYRRFRRNIGRQPVSPPRLYLRIVLLGLVTAMLLAGSLAHVPTVLGLLGGLVAGAPLALVGLKHTQFERTEQGDFYTPHTYIGLALSAVFLGRLAYRLLPVWHQWQAGSTAGVPDPGPLQRSPLTAAIFGLLAGYYIVYYLVIAIRSGRRESSDAR